MPSYDNLKAINGLDASLSVPRLNTSFFSISPGLSHTIPSWQILLYDSVDRLSAKI